MKIKHMILAITVFACVNLALPSCDTDTMLIKSHDTEEASQQPENNREEILSEMEVGELMEAVEIMEILTEEEFLHYIRNNDVGVTEDDFISVDIIGFIEKYSWTLETFKRLRVESALESYKRHSENIRRNEIYAHEVRSVDSTDEEYAAFVNAFLAAIDKEYEYVGKDEGLDRYDIRFGDSGIFVKDWHILKIGRTKDITQFDIRNDSSDGLVRLNTSSYGEGGTMNSFVYSCDNKYFLLVSSEDLDFSYWLSDVFIKTEPYE